MRLEIDLPDVEEREWLLDALAGLCSAGGGTPLLTEPVLPTSHWFPDRWDGREAGLERLVRRVFHHAGLGRQALELHVSADPASSSDRAVAWFAGLREGVLHVGVRTQLLEDPPVIAAALAHEAAHAWRNVHGIPTGDDRETEEFLTDATAVYLGFGPITANAASLHRSSGSLTGKMVRYRPTHDRYGYLPMASIVFLLVAQLVAQGAGWRARRRVRARLEANQAQVFDKAWRLLRRDAVGLRRRLALPAHSHVVRRAAPTPLRACEAAIVGDAVPESRRVAELAWPDNRGVTVFRYRSRRIGYALLSLCAGGGVLSLILWKVDLAVAQSPRLAMDLAVGFGTGALFGLRFLRVHEWCSDGSCGASLRGIAGTCPRCGGTIRGTVRSERERLAAEDELWEPPEGDASDDLDA